MQLFLARRRENRLGSRGPQTSPTNVERIFNLPHAAGIAALAWIVGILAAVWMLVPLAEYMQSGFALDGPQPGL